MEFRILGPLTISRAGVEEPVAGAKKRTVLVRLLLQPRQLVTPAALIEELWGDRAPASASNTLQTYVSQLRRLLEPRRLPRQEARILQSLPGGYLLDVQNHQVDALVFEEVIRDSRAALDAREPDKAADRLRMGLDLWRGPALADVPGVTAQLAAARLEELREVAVEMRAEAGLALGQHAELVGELEGLVSEHPWREQLAGHLMVALYRCQRQADALAVYRAARHRLDEELGVSPGPALQSLERRVLRQDPELEWQPAARVEVSAPDERPVVPPVRRRRRWALAVAALVVVLAGVGAWWGRSTSAVFNTFELAVRPGLGYDLDIPPGRPSDWHATNNPRSPDYNHLDFYRTSVRSPRDQISGVDLTNTNDFNAVHLVGSGEQPAVCHRLPQRGGGNVGLADLRVGAKVCLRTHEKRWAMITVTGMPESRAAVLLVKVVVLSS